VYTLYGRISDEVLEKFLTEFDEPYTYHVFQCGSFNPNLHPI